MRQLFHFAPTLVLAFVMCLPVHAQNWTVVLVDNTAGTNANQVNGTAGGAATLYGTIFNFTGTPSSDDGTGSPAPATLLDFGGFGFTLNPGQYDLGSLFTASDAPGLPQVDGSADGSTPGSSGYRSFGTFDLSGLAPGTYEEDFTAGAFPDDFNSTVPFDDIHGTLTLNVAAAPLAAVPESNTLALFALTGGSVFLFGYRRRRNVRNVE